VTLATPGARQGDCAFSGLMRRRRFSAEDTAVLRSGAASEVVFQSTTKSVLGVWVVADAADAMDRALFSRTELRCDVDAVPSRRVGVAGQRLSVGPRLVRLGQRAKRIAPVYITGRTRRPARALPRRGTGWAGSS
jgi:hypothetical protein